MEIIRILISADGIHIGVEPFALMKTVAFQRHALPLGQGVDNLHLMVSLLLDAKAHGALHTVERIVQTTFRCHKKRRGYTGQI